MSINYSINQLSVFSLMILLLHLLILYLYTSFHQIVLNQLHKVDVKHL